MSDIFNKRNLCTLKDCGDKYVLSVLKFLGVYDSCTEDLIEYGVSQGMTRSETVSVLKCVSSGNDCFLSKYVSDVSSDDFTKHYGRFINSVVRSKSVISQLGIMNEWQWFVTFTIDASKFNRYDFASFYRSFSAFCQNYKRDYGVKFKYLLVPEMHSDGAWHLHGLINDLPVEHLTRFERKDYAPFTDLKLPLYIIKKLSLGFNMYHWAPFDNKFGYTVVEEIRDSSKSSNYITKYIGKGFCMDSRFKGSKLYFCSHGLRRAKQIKKGVAVIPPDVYPVYDCDFSTVYNFSKEEYSLDDLLEFFN